MFAFIIIGLLLVKIILTNYTVVGRTQLLNKIIFYNINIYGSITLNVVTFN